MSRQLVPGETIPLELFPEAIRSRAARIGADALTWGGIVLPDIFQVLDASDEELRTAQLCKELTYDELDVWAEKLQARSSEPS